MKRGRVLAGLSVVAAVAWMWASTHAAAPPPPDRPNIVFILADDLGYGDAGIYGQQKIVTPNIDRLASEGIRFTQFYAGSTVCAPSRAVLMTGLHTGHVSVRGNAAGGNLAIQSLQQGDHTFVQELKAAGYATGQFGKWGLGEVDSPGHPNQKGFDEFFGYLNQTHAHNYYPSFLMLNSTRVPLRNVSEVETPGRGDGYAREKRDYAPAVIMDRALAWMDAHRAQPFFLYLSTTLPHANNEARRATGNGEEVPDLGPYRDQPWTEPNKGHAAMVRWLDGDVGTVMARLKALGLDDRTIVVFASDNGPHNEGGNDPEFFEAHGPLRGLKRSMTDGGIRVPFIVRWPGHSKAGTVSDHVGYFGDMFATVCDLLRRPAPASLDSVSLLPTLEGRVRDQRQHDYLYWEFYEQGGRQAVRFDRWKVIREPMYNGPAQVYDLVADPGELTDLAASRPEIAKRGLEYMAAAHRPDPRWTAK
jgi:arylsulfatase A-like enzyme